TYIFFFFFFQAEDGIRDKLVTGVQTCALPISFPNPNRDGQIILAATTTNLYIQNNIFYQPGQNVGISGTTSGAHIDHNLSTGTVGGGGIGSNIENTDPQFVNPSALDFRLQPGSPAVDAGTILSIVLGDFL